METVQQLRLIASNHWTGMGIEWVERVASEAATEIERLRAALTEIANEDFRGPRPHSAVVAFKALNK